MMLQIQDTLVTLDLAEQFFCCDLSKCLGACCIEGDAGAPVTEKEVKEIERVLPEVEADMMPRAIEEVRVSGVAYTDVEGDLVTNIIALEKAFREGRTDWKKPASCSLYPLRIKEFPTFTAVNYHRWKICRDAEALGRKKGIRLYQFLREPLIERFGADWYAELQQACELYLQEYGDNSPRR